MTVHQAPTIVACCRLPVDQLDQDDRISGDPQHVTCRMGEVEGVAEHLAHQISARHPDRPSRWIASLVGLTPEHIERIRPNNNKDHQ